MLNWLKFWNWFRKAELPALPEPEPIIIDANFEAIELEKEAARCQKFLAADQEMTTVDFEWCKVMWLKFPDELKSIIDSRLRYGFDPIPTKSLEASRDYLAQVVSNINDEIISRS